MVTGLSHALVGADRLALGSGASGRSAAHAKGFGTAGGPSGQVYTWTGHTQSEVRTVCLAWG